MKKTFALPDSTLLKNRYKTLRFLGMGGFGITYQILDTYTNMVYAMKEYAPSSICVRASDGYTLLPCTPEKESNLEHGRKRFLEEADLLRQLDSINGIVSVMDCFNQNNTSYFIMDYVEGISLNEYIKKNDGHLSLVNTLSIIGAIAYALHKVHDIAGIFHRDISPDNIFITSNNEVKVIDFGNAKHLASGLDQTYTIALKPGFSPPEQYSRKSMQGTYTDVYSLAGTMYYCLTGMMIPTAPERLNGNTYVPLKEIFPTVATSISNALDHALELDYHKRTADMTIFMKELGLDYTLYEDTDSKEPFLEIASGPYKGLRYKLLKNTCITIGRSKHNDITLDYSLYISKKHCELYFDRITETFYVEDYSTNGTYINDTRIAKNKLVKLLPEQTFSVGDKNTIMKVGIMNV